MSDTMSTPLVLYAIVPGNEALALGARARGIRLVPHGHLAAVVADGPPSRVDSTAALRHDRVVRLALESCSSVVPFRLGIELPSDAALRTVLELNALALAERLARFRGRVEMGVKARLTASLPSVPEPMQFLPGLERIRALAPEATGRQERIFRRGGGTVFAGCYLISRHAVDRFWSALEDIRRLQPELPLLGSGPWAPYSFCDLALRSCAQEREADVRNDHVVCGLR